MKIDYDVQTFQPITLLLWYHLLIYLPKAKFCVILAVVCTPTQWNAGRKPGMNSNLKHQITLNRENNYSLLVPFLN